MMPAVHKRQTILVIDDNITNLKVAVEHLKAYSFEILTARDGETGIQRALLARPDLILLDVQMPGIDGFETCRRLKANPTTAAIPMIMMTVLSETADKVRGRRPAPSTMSPSRSTRRRCWRASPPT
jgi:CheY-like chemotaxis protein